MSSSIKSTWLAFMSFVPLSACHDTTAPSPTTTRLLDLSTMAVGGVRTLTVTQAVGGITIPASQSSAVYAVIVANVAGDTGSVSQYTIAGNRLSTSGFVAHADRAMASIMAPTLEAALLPPRQPPFVTQLRHYEQALVSARSSRSFTVSPQRSATPSIRVNTTLVGVIPAVGSQQQFHVPNTSTDACATYASVTATVRSVSRYAIVATDVRTPSGGFTQASYDSIAAEFDHYIYPTSVGYFGEPTDVDHNGHVYILYTPIVNEQTPAGLANTRGYVGGYTFAGDFFPASGNNACAESNGGEIFYLMTPDPSGQFGNVFSTALVREQSRVTMAHELQHAINSGNRISNHVANLESTWLDEALSSLAEDAVGRVEGGFGDLQQLTPETFFTMDQNLFETFFSENLLRTQLYVSRPDTIGAVVGDVREEQDLAAFGAGWAWLRYLTDWFSNDNPRVFTRAVVAGPDTGTTNLVKHAGAPLDTLLSRWLVTLYTDGRTIPNLPAQYNYRSYALQDAIRNLCAEFICPSTPYLPVTSLGDGSTSITIGVPSTSADYFLLDQNTGGARTIHVTTPTGVARNAGRVHLVRLQ